MRKILSLCALILGVGCVVSAGYLFWDNENQEIEAQVASQSVVALFEKTVEAQAQTLDAELTQTPVVDIDGEWYLGVLSLPTLDLELPVANTWSYAKLQKTPCVYEGSLSDGNLIIAAHNFQAHFGTIDQIELGDEVTIVDAVGTVHAFTLTHQETVSGNDLDALQNGDWDLTLFTCVYGNNTNRVVLRFQQTDN